MVVQQRKTMDGARLGNITVTGKGLTANLVDACISAKFSAGTSKVTEMSLSFQDTGTLEIYNSGVLSGGTAVTYKTWDLWSRRAAIASGATGPIVSIVAASRYVEGMRDRSATGEFSWGSQDVSSWVRMMARAHGMEPVVQPGLGRRTIVRAKPDGNNRESNWDVLTNLAQDVGVWCFEYGNRLVFAKPSWLMANAWGRLVWDLKWDDWWTYTEGMVGMPAYSNDTTDGKESLAFGLVSADADTIRPGDEVNLSGRSIKPGGMGGRWIVTQVDFPMSIGAEVKVQCERAIDPAVQA